MRCLTGLATGLCLVHTEHDDQHLAKRGPELPLQACLRMAAGEPPELHSSSPTHHWFLITLKSKTLHSHSDSLWDLIPFPCLLNALQWQQSLSYFLKGPNIPASGPLPAPQTDKGSLFTFKIPAQMSPQQEMPLLATPLTASPPRTATCSSLFPIFSVHLL